MPFYAVKYDFIPVEAKAESAPSDLNLKEQLPVRTILVHIRDITGIHENALLIVIVPGKIRGPCRACGGPILLARIQLFGVKMT